jgi:hypothetical protein
VRRDELGRRSEPAELESGSRERGHRSVLCQRIGEPLARQAVSNATRTREHEVAAEAFSCQSFASCCRHGEVAQSERATGVIALAPVVTAERRVAARLAFLRRAHRIVEGVRLGIEAFDGVVVEFRAISSRPVQKLRALAHTRRAANHEDASERRRGAPLTRRAVELPDSRRARCRIARGILLAERVAAEERGGSAQHAGEHKQPPAKSFRVAHLDGAESSRFPSITPVTAESCLRSRRIQPETRGRGLPGKVTLPSR